MKVVEWAMTKKGIIEAFVTHIYIYIYVYLCTFYFLFLQNLTTTKNSSYTTISNIQPQNTLSLKCILVGTLS